jgi:hypothetical protein
VAKAEPIRPVPIQPILPGVVPIIFNPFKLDHDAIDCRSCTLFGVKRLSSTTKGGRRCTLDPRPVRGMRPGQGERNFSAAYLLFRASQPEFDLVRCANRASFKAVLSAAKWTAPTLSQPPVHKSAGKSTNSGWDCVKVLRVSSRPLTIQSLPGKVHANVCMTVGG